VTPLEEAAKAFHLAFPEAEPWEELSAEDQEDFIVAMRAALLAYRRRSHVHSRRRHRRVASPLQMRHLKTCF
jgi:hypothetical protein